MAAAHEKKLEVFLLGMHCNTDVLDCIPPAFLDVCVCFDLEA